MPNKITKIKFILILFLNVIVWCVFGFGINFIKSDERKIIEAESIIRENVKKQEMKIKIDKDLEDNKNESLYFKSYLLKEDGEVDLIRSLETLVKEYNLKSEIKFAKIETVKGTSSVETLSVGLDVIGTWDNIVSFYGKMEVMPYFVKITDFKMEKFASYDIKDSKVSTWLGSFKLDVLKLKTIND